MRATKTITKRGNAERVLCYHFARGEWLLDGGAILLETRFNEENTSFAVEMTPYEARRYAMDILTQLDRMQCTTERPK